MTEMTMQEKFDELYEEIMERFESVKEEDAAGMAWAIRCVVKKAYELDEIPVKAEASDE